MAMKTDAARSCNVSTPNDPFTLVTGHGGVPMAPLTASPGPTTCSPRDGLPRSRSWSDSSTRAWGHPTPRRFRKWSATGSWPVPSLPYVPTTAARAALPVMSPFSRSAVPSSSGPGPDSVRSLPAPHYLHRACPHQRESGRLLGRGLGLCA